MSCLGNIIKEGDERLYDNPSSRSSYSWVSRGLLLKTKWGAREKRRPSTEKTRSQSGFCQGLIVFSKTCSFYTKRTKGDNPYAEGQGGAVIQGEV